jgi:putative ABC transport system permease protein
MGRAPAVGDAADLVVVDATALAAAGLPAKPNTVWATGPGAAAAVQRLQLTRASAGDAAGTAVVRADVEGDRRRAPLTTGLLSLAWAASATMLALGLLGFALGVAAGSSERWQTLSRLRTLGLRTRDARWIAAGELLPPVLVAGVGGPLIGLLLARLTLGPLELRQLTGQLDGPGLAGPWWGFGLVTVALFAAIALLVPVESALRRRRRLGEILRAGGG